MHIPDGMHKFGCGVIAGIGIAIIFQGPRPWMGVLYLVIGIVLAIGIRR